MNRLVSLTLALCVAISFAQLDSSNRFIDPEFARANGYRLLQFNETFQRWYTAEETRLLTLLAKAVSISENCARHQGGYMDITDHEFLSAKNLNTIAKPLPTRPTRQSEVARIVPRIDEKMIQQYIETLSEFFTRYYTTETGEAAAKKIYDIFSAIAQESGRTDIEVSFFKHSWRQPSVIAKIKGSGENREEVVIISAHEDSINGGGSNRSPGADDDASGVSNVIETFRAIVQSGFKPSRTLEFHTYAAEEIGLRGSQDVATYYQRYNIPVHAHMQMDMTMYTRTPEYIAVMTDYVNSELTEFLKMLITEYTTKKVITSRCGYGCSDHASWTKAGFRSSFPFETEMSKDNPYIHSSQDLFQHLSLEHGVEFTKLSVAFLVELSY